MTSEQSSAMSPWIHVLHMQTTFHLWLVDLVECLGSRAGTAENTMQRYHLNNNSRSELVYKIIWEAWRDKTQSCLFITNYEESESLPSPLSSADITIKIYLKRAMKVNVQKIKESTP